MQTPDAIRHRFDRADALLGQGRRAEAAAAYRDALTHQPGRAEGWFNLAYALRHDGHFTEALDAYGRALDCGIDRAEQVHLNRAVILSDHLARQDEAESELHAALATAPGYPPALLNLGNLHEERGRRDDAIACYRRLVSSGVAQAGGPAYQALARLANLERPTAPRDPLYRELESAARSPAPIEDAIRADLWFALGRTHDALGEHAAAFDAFVHGKHLAHRGHRSYDPERASRLTHALIEAPAGTPRASSAADAGFEPLFICGMFRSGSTLIEQVLSAHPAVATCGELELLPRLAAGTLRPFPASLATLTQARASALAQDYRTALLARMPAEPGAPRYVTDKRPDNFRLIGLIKHLFPGARIVHTVRHPLDNGLSILMQHLNPRAFDYAGTLADIGHHHGEYLRLMAHWKRLYPGDIHDFDYDRFVAEPEATLHSLLRFLQLPWEPGCLAFHARQNTVRTASYWQVRRPLYAEASGRWRYYREQLAPLAGALASQGVALPDWQTPPSPAG